MRSFVGSQKLRREEALRKSLPSNAHYADQLLFKADTANHFWGSLKPSRGSTEICHGQVTSPS